jgi:hypothetical protein
VCIGIRGIGHAGDLDPLGVGTGSLAGPAYGRLTSVADPQSVPQQHPATAQQSLAAVEKADAAFFHRTPDPAALLAMLRPLAG